MAATTEAPVLIPTDHIRRVERKISPHMSPMRVDRLFWQPTYDPTVQRPDDDSHPAGALQYMIGKYDFATAADNAALHEYRHAHPNSRILDETVVGVNMGLVMGAAKQYGRLYKVPPDEAFQAALHAFNLTLKDFDPERGSLSTLFHLKANRLIKHDQEALYGRRMGARTVHVADLIGNGNLSRHAQDVELELPSGEDPIADADDRLVDPVEAFISDLIPDVTDRQRELLEVIARGNTIEGAAKIVGISESTAFRDIRNIRDRATQNTIESGVQALSVQELHRSAADGILGFAKTTAGIGGEKVEYAVISGADDTIVMKLGTESPKYASARIVTQQGAKGPSVVYQYETAKGVSSHEVTLPPDSDLINLGAIAKTAKQCVDGEIEGRTVEEPQDLHSAQTHAVISAVTALGEAHPGKHGAEAKKTQLGLEGNLKTRAKVVECADGLVGISRTDITAKGKPRENRSLVWFSEEAGNGSCEMVAVAVHAKGGVVDIKSARTRIDHETYAKSLFGMVDYLGVTDSATLWNRGVIPADSPLLSPDMSFGRDRLALDRLVKITPNI